MKHVQIGPNRPLHRDTLSQIILLGLVPIVFVIAWVDVTLFGSISEASVTELGQESLILAAACLFGFTAWRCPKLRSLLVLVAGLFGCMFIRELDAVFDIVFHGFWLYPALLLAAGSVIYATRCTRMSISESRELLMTSPFRLVCFGLLTVLVISRVAGTGKLWSFILDSESAGHFYKNIVQEGLELWGYGIIAVGAWYVMSQLTQTSASREKPQSSSAMPSPWRKIPVSHQPPTLSRTYYVDNQRAA